MPSTREIEIRVDSTPSYSSLLGLYAAVGWTAYTRKEGIQNLEEAIVNSSFVVTAWDGETLVGLARALSDDVAILYVQDILVRPEYQRQGIGEQLMAACLARYAHVRSKVLLTDDEQRQCAFYEKMGFRNTRDVTSTKLNTFVQLDGVD